jgi:hypothetical protein
VPEWTESGEDKFILFKIGRCMGTE